MFRRRIALSLLGLSFLLIGLMIAVRLRPKPRGLAGWTIIRTPEGLRLDVPVDWSVDVDPMGTRFANRAETRAVIESMQRKMDSVELYLDAGQAHVCDPALAMEAIRALLVK